MKDAFDDLFTTSSAPNNYGRPQYFNDADKQSENDLPSVKHRTKSYNTHRVASRFSLENHLEGSLD
jgi:hypothetical protein